MPVVELAAAAAGLIGSGFAGKLGERAAEAVADVLEAVRRRFSDHADGLGSAALAEVEKVPSDGQTVELLAGAVNRHLGDQAFAAELRRLLDAAVEQPELQRIANTWSVSITGHNYGQIVQAQNIGTLNIGGAAQPPLEPGQGHGSDG